MISCDSMIRKKRLPRNVFDLQNFRTDDFNKKRKSVLLRSPTKEVNNSLDASEYLEIRRQMCYFNIAVCFAKCGYITKAQLAIKCVDHKHFELIANYNKAIFELLSKGGSLQLALVLLENTVSLLERAKSKIWLIVKDFKQSLTFCLLLLREKFNKFVKK